MVLYFYVTQLVVKRIILKMIIIVFISYLKSNLDTNSTAVKTGALCHKFD